MTLHYPDISAYQSGIPINGPAVCVKATEGTNWSSSDYHLALGRAVAAGTFAFAYHFLHAGNAATQAQFAHRVVGNGVGLMLDFEPTTGSSPSVADAVSFIDAYRAAGGCCHLTYLPHWYWVQLGSPSLAPVTSRGQHLISSNYTAYTDSANGAGWAPYGGMTPDVWQYTSTSTWNGRPCDFNAFRGTLTQLKTMVSGKAPPRPADHPVFPYPDGHYLGQPSTSPYCHSGFYGGINNTNVHTWQACMYTRGWPLTMDGCYGLASEQTARAFQAERGLDVDGKVGKSTWVASWADPVT